MTSLSSSSAAVRSWRTAFLTLRDETLASGAGATSSSSIPQLLQHLVFSHSHSLVSAAPHLPPHEVTSDILFMLELVASNCHGPQDMTATFSHTSNLIHDVCRRVSYEISSSSWSLILDSFANMLEYLLNKADSSANAARITSMMDCLETIRRLISVCHRKCSPPEDINLVKFLLRIIVSSHSELICSYHSIRNQKFATEMGKRVPRYCSLWEVQTVAFSMLGETVSRDGSSIPVDVWKSMIEVIRKVVDFLASKSLLVEDNVMSRFYASLLHCMHLVLMDSKCSLSDHVTSFVVALRMFFTYGLGSRTQLTDPAVGHQEKELHTVSKLSLEEPKRVDHSPYRPPHLRKMEASNMKEKKARNPQSFSDHESSTVYFTSSDSDYSDSDGLVKDSDTVQNSKVRVAAIVCIQDLCQADSKSFTTQWTLLLPASDVLQPRKFEATLMTCFLYDPYLKARIASASALEVMLDGPSSIFLQVAEYKGSSKFGSFMALSSSLGQILMQLHTGVLYLVQRETHGRLLASLFKILMLLVSSTPYSRMPGDLLPTVITSLRTRINEGFSFRNDQSGLLAAAVSCLTAALSISPSIQVRQMLLEEISTGFLEAEKKSGVLFTLFQYAEQATSSNVCFEALQALKTVSHNYPNIVLACWGQVSTIVYGFLTVPTPEVYSRPWKGHTGDIVGFIGEKVITAAPRKKDIFLSFFLCLFFFFDRAMVMAKSRQIFVSMVFVLLVGLVGANEEEEADRILQLPGQPKVSFQQFSGYVSVNHVAGRSLFYWLTEAAHNPLSKPLVVWLNGGPGCSSVAYGASEEIGPFRINRTASGLYLNKFSWNTVANLLFLETPAGVGFSYSNRSSDLFDTGDRRTARDSLEFLIRWLDRFPRYKHREVYLTGESYAGHYVPQLAKEIVTYNKHSKNPINLKGFMVGNAVTDNYYDNLGTVTYWWSHAMISDKTYRQLINTCDFRRQKESDECESLYSYAMDQEFGNIDQYNIYAPPCNNSDGSTATRQTMRLPHRPHPIFQRYSGYDPCTEKYAEIYYNRPDVQKALHANTTKIPYKWTACNEVLNRNWNDTEASILPIYRELIASGLRIWVFSGDVDSVVPVTATRYSLAQLKLETKIPWYPWYVKTQVGGWTEVYEGLTFATVRGAGHEVPLFKPRVALQLFESFIRGLPLPKSGKN